MNDIDLRMHLKLKNELPKPLNLPNTCWSQGMALKRTCLEEAHETHHHELVISKARANIQLNTHPTRT